MALHIGNDTLSSRVLIDSLGANSAFYHKRCSTKLQNEYLKKKCADRKGKIDARQKKRHLGTKSLPLRMTKKSIQVHKGQVLKLKLNLVGLEIHDIENIYQEQLPGITWNLSGYHISFISHARRFVKQLVQRSPNYKIMKDSTTTHLHHKDIVNELFWIFLSKLDLIHQVCFSANTRRYTQLQEPIQL